MFELLMAALLIHLEPSLRLEQFEDFAATRLE
jgi:hypothetical protein